MSAEKKPQNKNLLSKTTKFSNIQENKTENSSTKHSTASGLSQEAEDQFELELCWCIQQLKAGLMNMKLQDKQVFNMTKSLNVLKSSNASLIKKRQVMRNTFGDYRAKMAEDEKKFIKTTSAVKFTPCKKLEKKSLFLKKAHSSTTNSKEQKEFKLLNDQSNRSLINPNNSNEPFVFNFSSSNVV